MFKLSICIKSNVVNIGENLDFLFNVGVIQPNLDGFEKNVIKYLIKLQRILEFVL